MTTMLVLGFLGSAHCLGMCGGFVVGLGGGKGLRRHQAGYQLGRLMAYTFLGAVLGAVGMTLKDAWPGWGHRLAMVVAGTVMLAMGFALAGARLHLPAASGGRLLVWLGRLLKGRSLQGSMLLGMATGLLPCGLLYAALARAVAAPDPVRGAMLMGAFWLGTVPALAVAGALGLRKAGWWPRLAALVTIALGALTISHGLG